MLIDTRSYRFRRFATAYDATSSARPIFISADQYWHYAADGDAARDAAWR